jgi:hypothetical protein
MDRFLYLQYKQSQDDRNNQDFQQNEYGKKKPPRGMKFAVRQEVAEQVFAELEAHAHL